MSAGANLGAGRSGPMPQGRLYSVATFANLTGAPISAFNHAKLLRGHFASACLVLPGPGDIVDRAEAAGVPVLMLPMVNRGLRSRLLRLSLARDLLAVLGSRWNYYRALCREFRRAPGIVHVHDSLSIAPLAFASSMMPENRASKNRNRRTDSGRFQFRRSSIRRWKATCGSASREHFCFPCRAAKWCLNPLTAGSGKES